ncbi:MAG: hypothetical protein QOK40_1680 [Miltoncostaeaceae bacterium]|nr:hypothetical protein [Miltoncostaeaceae bacterium]
MGASWPAAVPLPGDQTLADSEQTLADSDQTLSDVDQTSSESDQLAADRDQAASDRDLAYGVNPGAHEASRDIRERSARLREQTAHARGDAATGRDTNANARDLAALARDRAADARDLAMAQREAAHEQRRDTSLAGDLVIRAAEQRERAAEHRAKAAEHRALAAQDRHAAAEDREQAARDRLHGEAALRASEAHLAAEREAQHLNDEFLALVSHEFRTPLTSITGHIEMLGEATLSADVRWRLGVVSRNAERLLRLVDDVLLLASSDSGQLQLRRSDLDLAQLIRQCVEEAGPQAQAQTVGLSMALDEVPPVHGDPARIGQLLNNLISNAIKFTPAGGSVRLALERRERAVLVTVTDTGPGIPADEQPRLFERFFRSEGSGSVGVPGNGLGLSIAKAIIEAHGGRIWVESDEGHGASFCVELPPAGGV